MDALILGIWIFMAWYLPRLEEERVGQDFESERPKPIVKNLEKMYFDLGKTHEKMGQHIQAIGSYKQAIRLNPKYAQAHYRLGKNYILAERYQNSLEPLKRAIHLNPKETMPYIYLGWVNERLGSHESAVESLKKALWDDPETARRYAGLRLLIIYPSGREMTVDLDVPSLLDPKLAVTFFRYGLAHIKLERYYQAIEELKEAVRLDPEFFDAHYALGLAYEKAGMRTEALKHYQQAVKDKPQYPEAEFKLVEGQALSAA